MEDLSRRVPLINQLILKNVDGKSKVNFKHTSRAIHQVLEKERMFWILMMKKYRGTLRNSKNPGKL